MGKKNNVQAGQLAPGQEERPRPLAGSLSLSTGHLNETFLSALSDLFAGDLLDAAFPDTFNWTLNAAANQRCSKTP